MGKCRGRCCHLPLVCHCTATVMFGRLLLAPAVNITGTLPEATLSGTTAFTCSTPETRPGASPAYSTFAVMPPIDTEMGATGRGKVGPPADVTEPVTPPGISCPSPVA